MMRTGDSNRRLGAAAGTTRRPAAVRHFRRWAALALIGCLLCTAAGPAEDLYDPDEAERYRRKPKPLTENILDTAASQPDGQPAEPKRAGPASQPESPFAATPQTRRDMLPGYIELSDGTILPGRIYTTRKKPWSLYEEESKSFRRIPPVVVRQIDVAVVWERDEPEWRWKDQGSDVKVYTGRTYPARLLNYAFTLVNGQKLSGTVQQPIYVRLAGAEKTLRFILHERDKGPLGTKLPSLVYVKHVYLGRAALVRGKELAARRAAENPATQPEQTK